MEFYTNNNFHKECIVCENKFIRQRYMIDEFKIVLCPECSFQFVANKLSAIEIKEFYENDASIMDDLTYIDEDNVANLNYYYMRLAKLLNERKTFGKILDVGCNAGYFLDCMEGWERHGVEIVNSQAAKAKEKYGDNIFNGAFENYEISEQYFDIITLQDVLDHMTDPIDCLKRCKLLLRPNGLIVVKVHNISCLFSKLCGSKFYAICPPVHLGYFNKKSLNVAFNQSGLMFDEYKFFPSFIYFKMIPYRMSKKNKDSIWYNIYEMLNNTKIGNLGFQKNLHDIITVFGHNKN
jgi:SAM-dependent methyltransferase|tara:strand:- start:166 stop:1044 length:879 start_codon:yes stop_codon:yes gene_type:complete